MHKIKNMKAVKRSPENPFAMKKSTRKKFRRKKGSHRCNQDALDKEFLSLKPSILKSSPSSSSSSSSTSGPTPQCDYPVQEYIVDIIKQTEKTELSDTIASSPKHFLESSAVAGKEVGVSYLWQVK